MTTTANFEDRMADYVPVNERIGSFYEEHPEGSIQSEIVELTAERVTVKAYAYRSADDARPGIGHSSLNIPGSTPYTRGSEIENAETSAWGRAIAALGFEVKRGIASAEEVANKATETAARPQAAPRPAQRPTAATDTEGGECPKHHKPWRTNSKGYYDASKDDSTESGWCELKPSDAWQAAQEVA